MSSLNEQEKIANFLCNVDDKIELLKKELSLYKSIKKSLIHKIFVQGLRFKEFNGKRINTKLGDIFDERNEKGFENLDLLSVTLNKGVIKRLVIESKDNSSDDKSNYKRVLKNDIPYNSMRMWQGASGVSKYDGIVSPAYTVLKPKVEIFPNFVGYYFKTHYWYSNLRNILKD